MGSTAPQIVLVLSNLFVPAHVSHYPPTVCTAHNAASIYAKHCDLSTFSNFVLSLHASQTKIPAELKLAFRQSPSNCAPLDAVGRHLSAAAAVADEFMINP